MNDLTLELSNILKRHTSPTEGVFSLRHDALVRIPEPGFDETTPLFYT